MPPPLVIAALAEQGIAVGVGQAVRLVEVVAQKELTATEQSQFRKAMEQAMADAARSKVPPGGSLTRRIFDFPGRQKRDRRLKKAGKVVNTGEVAAPPTRYAEAATPTHPKSSPQGEETQEQASMSLLQIARDELLDAFNAAEMTLWRQRVTAGLWNAAVDARGGEHEQEWARLVTGEDRDGSQYSDDVLLSWASSVVCRFDVLAREPSRGLLELVASLDRHDLQATQLAHLNAAQGIRRMFALVVFVALVAAPIDAEAIHLIF